MLRACHRCQSTITHAPVQADPAFQHPQRLSHSSTPHSAFAIALNVARPKDNLPASSTFGIDGSAWAVTDRFRGLKMLPDGLHLFMAAAGSTAADLEIFASGGGGIRHAFLRFLGPQEVLIRRWSPISESFERPLKRPRMQTPQLAEIDVIDGSSLKALDPNLAPYPFDKLQQWKTLTNRIDEICVGRVLGFDERGDANVDALMDSAGDSISRASGRASWGEFSEADRLAPAGAEEQCLRYLVFDLRRSWRPGATGEEVTRDARDKSQLLLRTVDYQLNGGTPSSSLPDEPFIIEMTEDFRQLLAEIQLAFVLFVNVLSTSSLDAYKQMISLICRSQAAFEPEKSTGFLPLAILTDILPAQIAWLHSDKNVHESVELDAFFIAELTALRSNLRAVDRAAEVPLRVAWQNLNTISGFRLGVLDGEQKPPDHEVQGSSMVQDMETVEDEEEPLVVVSDDAQLMADAFLANRRAHRETDS